MEFEFDGLMSSMFGLLICNFGGKTDGASTLGGVVSVNTVKSPRNNRWINTTNTYDEQLSFTFQVMKYNCSNRDDIKFEPREVSKIMKWLNRNDGFHYLRFCEDEWANYYYNCHLSVQKYVIGGDIVGFEIEATCDAPWGYSEPKKYTFKYKGEKSFNIYSYSDECGGFIPDLIKIDLLENSNNFTITNKLVDNLGETITKSFTEIKNCKKGETIYIDRSRNIHSSDATHTTLPDDFNYDYFKLFNNFNNNKNVVTISSGANIEISYREIRKGVLV